ncbi:GlsB/YeaQ/YmgE family stress response membrane protein [Kaistia algarum]|uniref:GlsB/YeaQ/YmgE family stress response membrane protein n=1 Tax=Kaistia algarum TaxID=2083279 RepID=UPI000CE91F3B|nr:GlsB/YeaQ/YmgE family stress response membrane protein [Kaistia algarum]MCX5515667.1 GlsB/YeaQ/YmgE family stress response membrane protein [Kaistia algarum]PPE80949.1 GlsB/YeaQ/YmgE family stress response membrane protein [Kaistia algarum]
MGIIWTIIIGGVAGIIAKFITPGDNEPKGFILTILLGIAGAFIATWLGQAIGWYGPNDQAGFIGAIVGAVILLLIWGAVVRKRG